MRLVVLYGGRLGIRLHGIPLVLVPVRASSFVSHIRCIDCASIEHTLSNSLTGED